MSYQDNANISATVQRANFNLYLNQGYGN